MINIANKSRLRRMGRPSLTSANMILYPGLVPRFMFETGDVSC